MRRKQSKVVIMLLAMVMVFAASAVWAGQATNPDAAIAAAKAKSAQIDLDLKAKKADINQRYERQARQLELAQRVAIQAAVVPAVDDGVVPAGRGFRRMLTGGVKAIFTAPGALLVGAEKGVKYVSDSPLENPVSRLCRGLNVGLDQTFGNTFGCAMEIVTPWQTNIYADPSQLNSLASETITWGPLAQMGRVAAYTIPPGMLATCSLSGIHGVSQAGSMLIYGASGYGAGGVLNKGVSFAEKYATKAVFGK